jgi:arsenite methyltransferase
MRSSGSQNEQPSLEKLIETEDIGIEILHPGGMEITRELAEHCGIREGARVLDVASGTGESACLVAKTYGCYVTGVDFSEYMVERAARKARERGLLIEFIKGDAHHLPFADDTFDAVISECTICLLDKEKAVGEMVRVVKRGGCVGMHDVCWKQGVPDDFRRRLAEIENERPETIEGWKALFERAGLLGVAAEDRSFLLHEWTRQMKRRLGIWGQFRIFLKVARRWGPAGLKAVWESEKIFESGHLGYCLVTGEKR